MPTQDIRMLQADGSWDMSPHDDPLLEGDDAVAEQIARRFATVRGSLPHAPDIGTDLVELLNDDIDVPAIRAMLAGEARGDERVAAATVDGGSPDALFCSVVLEDGTELGIDL